MRKPLLTTCVRLTAVLWLTALTVCNVKHDSPLAVQETPTYSVIYDGNGSTGGSAPTDSTSYAQGATVTVKGNTGNLVKSGSLFTGWNTAADASGTSYSAASTFVMGDAAVTLFAQWAVIAPPAITAQPQRSQTVTAGETVTFTVTATGTSPLSYQWYKDSSAIPGATSSSYSISSVQAADVGAYTVTVSNGIVPNATSAGAVLTVMKDIPAGTFTMGSNDSLDNGAQPAHQVTLSAFRMQATEVTQGQYLAAMGMNPSSFKGDLSRPVEQVSWYYAARFCNTLSTLSGLAPVYDTTTWAAEFTKSGFRLPTEAQWEYACRAGTATAWWWGDDTAGMGARAWFGANSGSSTHPVAARAANGFGLFDMAGNVWEWCGDWNGPYGSAAQTDPTGATGNGYRIVRGGGWGSTAVQLRCAHRDSMGPLHSYTNFGFRVALPAR